MGLKNFGASILRKRGEAGGGRSLASSLSVKRPRKSETGFIEEL